MANHNVRGLRRILNALGFSMAGFRDCFRHEEAFRQEVFGNHDKVKQGRSYTVALARREP